MMVSQQCSDPSAWWVPGIQVHFSKRSQIPSLMHNGKNEILLEKNQSVSYVFYMKISHSLR